MTLQTAIKRTVEIMVPLPPTATDEQIRQVGLARLRLITMATETILTEAEVDSYLDVGPDVPGGGAA